MRSRVELFEQIRRDREFAGVSTHALARKYGVHRRTVRQALESPVPPARKRPEGRSAPKLGEWRELIDSWLIADRAAPRKQRHTAKRIHERLLDEHGVEVSERQVRRYVRERRQQLGELVDEVFVPLCSEPAAEAEVDWGEALVVIAGVPTKVYLFLMRSCFSGACCSRPKTITAAIIPTKKRIDTKTNQPRRRPGKLGFDRGTIIDESSAKAMNASAERPRPTL